MYFLKHTQEKRKKWMAYDRAMSQVYKNVDINIAQGKPG